MCYIRGSETNTSFASCNNNKVCPHKKCVFECVLSKLKTLANVLPTKDPKHRGYLYWILANTQIHD